MLTTPPEPPAADTVGSLTTVLDEGRTASVSQPASQAVSDPGVPLIRRPEVLQKLQAHQWVDLARDAVVQKYLLHHCPVCFQWCADAVGLKHHLAHAHASWLETKAEAQHLLKAFRRAIVLPCRFCHQVKVNKDRHYLQCPTLSICAYLQAWHESILPRADGSQSRGGSIFRTERRSGCPTAYQTAPTRAQPGLFDDNDDQGQRQREERERKRQASVASVDVGLHQWFRRLGQPMAPGNGNLAEPAPLRRGGLLLPTHAEPHQACATTGGKRLPPFDRMWSSTCSSRQARAALSLCSTKQQSIGAR